jgi:two-component system, response regulator
MERKSILLVEDDEDQAVLATLIFRRRGVVEDIAVASDGKEALDYLFGARTRNGQEADSLPKFVLLDVRLPGMSGLKVLRRIRADERTRFLPVVILSFYDERDDVLAGYRHGANSFVTKSLSHERFAETLARTVRYWLNLNRSP